ncbi:DUF692 family multinuclear iron-containing protein [Pseudomonas sp. BIC9C]|uniref:multinuclear nonheme iron-dependent oxidase n=1 Tax=Pseudomonas sp. BIC9C TaxID=3078458 RepID=UPI003A521879
MLAIDAGAMDFLECTPDNRIQVGGRQGDVLEQLPERFLLVSHGLSLPLGGPAPLDHERLRRTREFFDRHKVAFFSKLLSYCSDDSC